MHQKRPEHNLDDEAITESNSRIGIYKQGTIDANGEWQPILAELKGCNIFEVIAVAYGETGEGKYATLHAIVSNAYTGNRGAIRLSSNYYGWQWWRRIGLRWVGTPFSYNLEMKTYSNYGNSGKIQYSINKLGKNIV